ncbi:MAG: sigma-70 family RNA polymerase sigma factor [Deferribacteres bacterium]|nr:sigma-70 family RNA polymerase sigma factor [candidate division KSB1 bacterium]MCB9500987.1 sigma-70 family RNA polymerase sigma factor [Deferribacteres bacterium]
MHATAEIVTNAIRMTNTLINERDLILRCQQGDKDAFGTLVKKYMQRAYYTALGFVGSHENALDLSQEAFVRAYRAIQRLDADRSFYTWYYTILRNLCLNFKRDKAKKARSFSEIGETSLRSIRDKDADTAHSVELSELQSAVWTALEKLTANEKEIIILRDIQELAYHEIAQTLDIPIGTVMSRLYNARRSLRAQLDGKI